MVELGPIKSTLCSKRRQTRFLVVSVFRLFDYYFSLQIKARKRGGDPEKKRTRRRKRTGKRKGRGDTKKNKNLKVVKLVSSAGTGYFYANKRNTKNKKKLEINKYDPDVKRHVKFAEVK